ncbi:MAG: GHKL domain-containing protein, partial [Clostridia bacterium]|nr:GHKL domain-containing protein [Clostridia bacterium]
TTKSDKHLHGIGLSSVKQTVKGYKGTFATKCKDNVFNAEIMIPI